MATDVTRKEKQVCPDCGEAFKTKPGRHRVILEDFAESTGAFADWKLCPECWYDLYDALQDTEVGQ